MAEPAYLGICFDLDGTLLDTLDDLAAAVNRALARHGYPPHPAESYKRFVGDGASVLIQRALPPAVRDDAGQVARCLADFRTEYDQAWSVRSRLYDGVAEMLDLCAARRLRLAVVSNKPHPYTLACMQRFFARWPFGAIHGQQDGVPRKPDPATTRQAARELDLSPGDMLFVGDSNVDMQTGAAAGMLPVGVAWGYRPVDELIEAGARHILQSPGELRLVLDSAPAAEG